MPLPTPEPGLVICYEFLWSHEHDLGSDEGEKKRPTVILSVERLEGGGTWVTVVPITHRQPTNLELAIEIPAKVRTHLGLNSRASWIILNELNDFPWPGRDIYPIPGGRLDQFHYGFLPPNLFRQVRDAILALDDKRKRIMARCD